MVAHKLGNNDSAQGCMIWIFDDMNQILLDNVSHYSELTYFTCRIKRFFEAEWKKWLADA